MHPSLVTNSSNKSRLQISQQLAIVSGFNFGGMIILFKRAKWRSRSGVLSLWNRNLPGTTVLRVNQFLHQVKSFHVMTSMWTYHKMALVYWIGCLYQIISTYFVWYMDHWKQWKEVSTETHTLSISHKPKHTSFGTSHRPQLAGAAIDLGQNLQTTKRAVRAHPAQSGWRARSK